MVVSNSRLSSILSMMAPSQAKRICFTLPDHTSYLYTRTEVMKPAHIFRDQVNTVTQWFDQWNDIEQTIACYSLLKRLGPTQARFLSLVLEHTFKDTASEVLALEEEANGKEFLQSLCQESKDVAVQQLLLHLPLLHPGNDDARHEYLKLLPKILTHSLEFSIHEEECRQLLSLALVHPAFVPEERSSLTWWLGLLEDKGEQAKEKHRPPPGFNAASFAHAHSPLTSTKSACEFVRSGPRLHQPVTMSHSFNKVASAAGGWRQQPALAHTDSGISTSFDNGLQMYGHNGSPGNHDIDEHVPLSARASRSLSFPVDPSKSHQSLSPQSSLDSDEERALKSMNALVNEQAHPGMRDIPMWLKSLRLHKYSSIFSDLTYEEMLTLTEAYLDSKGVTKGARNKILLCVQKLRERSSTLRQLEKDVLQLGHLPQILSELKMILMTPLKPYRPKELADDGKGDLTAAVSDEDSSLDTSADPKVDEDSDEHLHTLITRVMGKACTQILVTQPDEECCLTYLGLLDRVLGHDAFSMDDKRRMQSWKAQCQKLARQLATNRKLAGIDKGPRNWFDPLGYGNAAVANNRRRLTNRTNSLKSGMIPGGVRAGPLAAQQSLHKRLGPTASYNPIKGHQQISRTKSAPIRSNDQLQQPGYLIQDVEGIDQSLETLCLSMTNHALDDDLKNEDTF